MATVLRIATKVSLYSRVLAGMIGACFATAATAEVGLTVSPACPKPTDSVTVTTVQGIASAFLTELLSVARADRTIKIVIRTGTVSIPGAPPTTISANLGPLQAGDYHVDVFTRAGDGAGQLEPEVHTGLTDFRVESGTQPCAGWTIAITDGGVQAARTSSPFAKPVTVRVTDSNHDPVAGAEVHFARLALLWDFAHAAASAADGIPSTSSVRTDSNGNASMTFTANGIAGTYQYLASVIHANVTHSRPVVLSNRSSSGNPVAIPVIEYVNGVNMHYFMTSNPEEMALLDEGVHKNWYRTGAAFLAFPPGTTVGSGTNPVCRFYGKPEAGLDSHFYSGSPAECEEVVKRFSASWVLETNNAFEAYLPDAISGACPSDSAPVYRVFNNRADANHRYLVSQQAAKSMTSAGWIPKPFIPEGYGPDAVALCVPL